MPIPSTALRDFALVLDTGSVDLQRVEKRLSRLRADYASQLRIAELHASAREAELVLLLRFARTESPSLLRRMQTEAERLGGELIDVAALRETPRSELYERLGRFELRADVTAESDTALEAFAERLGIGEGRAPVFTFEAADRDELLRLYVRNVARGLPARSHRLATDRSVRVRLVPREGAPFELEGRSSSEAEAAVFGTPTPELERIVAIEAARLRAGRPSEIAGEAVRRDCHLVARRPGVAPEPLIALGSESLLLLPGRPIPEAAELTLTVASASDDPTFEPFELRAVGTDSVWLGQVEARRLRIADAEPLQAFQAALARLAARPPRLLALLADAPLRHALAERLRGSGIELVVPEPAEVEEALERELLRTDALLLDLDLKVAGGDALLERVDTLGRAATLRIVVLARSLDPKLPALGPVRDLVRKGEPIGRLLRGIDRCLGR